MVQLMNAIVTCKSMNNSQQNWLQEFFTKYPPVGIKSALTESKNVHRFRSMQQSETMDDAEKKYFMKLPSVFFFFSSPVLSPQIFIS